MTKQNICSIKFQMLGCLQGKLLPWKYQTQQNLSSSTRGIINQRVWVANSLAMTRKNCPVQSWGCTSCMMGLLRSSGPLETLYRGFILRSLAVCTVVPRQNIVVGSLLNLKWRVCSCLILLKHGNWDISSYNKFKYINCHEFSRPLMVFFILSKQLLCYHLFSGLKGQWSALFVLKGRACHGFETIIQRQ